MLGPRAFNLRRVINTVVVIVSALFLLLLMISSCMSHYPSHSVLQKFPPSLSFLIEWNRVNITGDHYSHHKCSKLQIQYLTKIEYSRYYSSLNEIKLWFLEVQGLIICFIGFRRNSVGVSCSRHLIAYV